MARIYYGGYHDARRGDRCKDSRYGPRGRGRRQDSREAKSGARRRDSRRGGDRSPWRTGDKRQAARSRSRSQRGGRRPVQEHRRRSASASVECISSSSGYSDSGSDSGSDSESRASSASGKKAKKKNKKDNSADSDKDEIVHFSWTRGMVLNSRYRMTKLLGDGTFGRVLLATDERERRQVAIKVIRDVERYQENAQIEADILKDIRRKDPRGEASRSAIMHDTFIYHSHFCLVFEPCGSSLYDFLKRNQFRGFWIQDIQTMAEQSLSALSFLHEQMQMTHTDLKPENILLESMQEPRPVSFPRQSSWKPSSSKSRASSEYLRPTSPNIRLIDFGNATYEDEHHSSIINTRQYRSPEVILSLGWNSLSDIWSMGCILMELYTGELLFGTHDNFEHLALMERTLEPVPSSMLSKASRSVRDKYVSVDRYGHSRLAWPERAPSSSSQKHVRCQKRLHDLMASDAHSSFADLVGDMLTMDPSKRPSARKAMQHKFFSKNFSD